MFAFGSVTGARPRGRANHGKDDGTVTLRGASRVMTR